MAEVGVNLLAGIVSVGLLAAGLWTWYALSHYFKSRSASNEGDKLSVWEAFRGDYEASASGNIRLNRKPPPGYPSKRDWERNPFDAHEKSVKLDATYPYLCDYCFQNKDKHTEGPGL